MKGFFSINKALLQTITWSFESSRNWFSTHYMISFEFIELAAYSLIDCLYQRLIKFIQLLLKLQHQILVTSQSTLVVQTFYKN